MRLVRLSPALIVAALLSGPALAQAQPQANATTSNHTTTNTKKATTTTTRAPVVRTTKSIDCSKQADTKGLHGKPRKSFMSSCKKA